MQLLHNEAILYSACKNTMFTTCKKHKARGMLCTLQCNGPWPTSPYAHIVPEPVVATAYKAAHFIACKKRSRKLHYARNLSVINALEVILQGRDNLPADWALSDGLLIDANDHCTYGLGCDKAAAALVTTAPGNDNALIIINPGC